LVTEQAKYAADLDDQTKIYQEDLKAFDQVQPEMVRFFNEIKASVHAQMNENYEEIKEAFNKKIV